MSNGIENEKCPVCPHIEESFEEDGPDGATEAMHRLLKHMETVHELNDEQQTAAFAADAAYGLHPGDREKFLHQEEATEDDYEKTTGHKLYCTAGFNDQCLCGARPDLAVNE